MKIIIKTFFLIKTLLGKSERIKAIGVALLLVVNSILELAGLSSIFPLFVLLLEDNVVEKYSWANWIYLNFNLASEHQLIIVIAVSIFLIFLIKNLISLIISKIQSEFSYLLFKNLALRLHKHVYSLGLLYFTSENSNYITRNIRVATERFSKQMFLGMIGLFNELLVLSFILIGLLIYNFKILIILLITIVPIFLIFLRWIRRKSLELSSLTDITEPLIYKNISESVFGYIDVTVSGSYSLFKNKIKKNLADLAKIGVKTHIHGLYPTKLIETTIILALAIMLSLGVYFLESKAALVELLGLFVLAGYRIIPSINRISLALNDLNRNTWVFELLEPLAEKKEVEYEVNSIPLIFENEIKLESIYFKYERETPYVIEDFSLSIKKGEVIGIVGPSGSGKTTLMNILLGFLKPNQGNYFIDNVEICKSNLASFYKKVGYVQQQVFLIDATLAENIAFGLHASEIDSDKLNKVLIQSSLMEMTNNLTNGTKTMIGENGVKFSGGQRQRIGIARALYFGAEILFFDEATSSLDEETEHQITESINKLSDGKLTIIIIAHRKSTLENCDRIIQIKPNY